MNQNCNLHVLHVVSGDLWAGAEVQMCTLATTLQTRLGATVTAVVLNPGRLEQELCAAGIRVIVLDESKLSGIRILRELIRIVREQKPDVVHTHRTKENTFGSIAARLGGIPSLRTSHGAPEHTPGWHDIPARVIQFLDWFSGRFLQRRIIAVSNDLARILEHEYPSRRVRIIENGIDIEALDSRPASREDTESTLHVGIAGRLVPVKRVDLFIRAAKQLHESLPQQAVEFHIFGDGPLRTELEALVESLHAGRYVRFEGHRDDIPAVLRDLDLLMMTSDHEGLPMILLEAMTLGTPIVAHRVGGITRLLDDGACGVLVEDHSPEGYASAMLRILQDPERRRDIAARARQRIEQHYSAEQNARAYCDEYRSILS